MGEVIFMEEFNLEGKMDGEPMEQKSDFFESNEESESAKSFNEGINVKDELIAFRNQLLELKEHEPGDMKYETQVDNSEDFDINKWFQKAIERTESKEELKGLKKWVLENAPEDDDPRVKELVLKIQRRKRK